MTRSLGIVILNWGHVVSGYVGTKAFRDKERPKPGDIGCRLKVLTLVCCRKQKEGVLGQLSHFQGQGVCTNQCTNNQKGFPESNENPFQNSVLTTMD